MKKLLPILLCILSVVSALSQTAPIPTPVMIENFSTNTVVITQADFFGNSSVLSLPPGSTFNKVITGGTFAASSWSLATPDTGQQLTIVVSGPYTDSGTVDGSGNEIFYPTFVSTVTAYPAWAPASADIVEYWIWGVCTAIVLGLAGSMRRMLGRVHEVNTDL
jgi:hypothetical protein